jgi:D-amino-acid dehydrogenase
VPASRAEVVVVGGGVIGVCAAFSLAERGLRPVLLERGEICSGASHGNAGWIFPSHAMPIPGPGVVRQSLRWLADPESPLYIRPRASAEFARWMAAFLRACTGGRAREAFRLRRDLGLASLERYEKLAALPGLDFGFERRGILLACRTSAALREVEEELELLRAHGGSAEPLSADALRERAPALSPDVAGGAWLSADAHLTPDRFVRGLAAEAVRRGADVRTHCEVLAVERAGSGWRLTTARGDLACDELVLAAGAWSPLLGGQLGLRLPVEGAKGYSVTVRRPAGFGERPIMLAEAKVGLTPMGDWLRFAGTLELAGLDLSLNLRRVRAIERAVHAWLPGLAETEKLETWRGLRPLTPDDLPIIGRPRGVAGLVIATGHGMTGMAQGPATGEIVAQIVTGEPTLLDTGPFSPDRFRGGGRG